LPVSKLIRLGVFSSGAALLAALACGDESHRLGRRADLDQSSNPPGGTTSAGAGAAGSAGAGGTGGATGVSGVSGRGGSLGDPDFPGSPYDSGASCTPASGACACMEVALTDRRVDVIAVVDTSPSMADELVGLEAALNGSRARSRRRASTCA
jgi:hypothetical protein